MKRCPVCLSVAFDDAATCFGCMHRFADDEGESREKDKGFDLPQFLVTMTPVWEQGQLEWSVEVETQAVA